MRIFLTTILSFSLAAAMILPITAYSQAPTTALSLQDCIAIAQQNQIDILTGKQSVNIASSRIVQTQSNYYPQISVGYNPFSITGGSGGRSPASSSGASLSVTQTIYDSGLTAAQVSGAKYGLTQSSASLTRTLQSVTFSVTNAYFEALRARHLADVADANVVYLQGQLDLVRTRIEVGVAARSDELPVVAQLANARVNQLSAQNAIRTSLISLQSAMGIPSQTAMSIQDIGAPAKQELQPVGTYLMLAEANRPDIIQAKAAIGSAQASAKSAKIAKDPRLFSNGQYNMGTDANLSNGNSSWQINAGITYDIFNGRKNRAAYDQARANLLISKYQAEQVSKNISAQVETAYYNLTNAGERMTASAVSLQAAQQNFDAQQARYKEGLAIPLDLLNAQLSLTTAQSNEIAARYDYYEALAQLDFATGKQGGSYAN